MRQRIDVRLSSMRFLAVVCASLFLIQCDSTTPGEEAGERVIAPREAAELTIPDLRFYADTSGTLRASLEDRQRIIFDSGIWLAGVQGGEIRASLRAFDFMNMTLRRDEQMLGVYRLDADSLDAYTTGYWPSEFGAPATASGRPRLVGDEMLWSAFLPHPRVDLEHFRPASLMAFPLHDVVVAQTVSAFQRPGLREVTFIDYKIINQGVSDVAELHVGFYADVDLHHSGCYHLGSNSVGHDLATGIVYVYPSESSGDNELDCRVRVIGFSLMDTMRPAAAATYHVPLGKNWDLDGFSEAELREPADVLDRLRGRSSYGEPIIDPTTEQPTHFAFSGDPVSGSGWLGIESDIRILLAAGGFHLASGERVEMTVVAGTADGDRLSEALEMLRQQFDAAAESGVLRSFRSP